MKSVPKLIKRFVGLLMLSFFFLLMINVAALALLTADQRGNGSPWTMASRMAESIQRLEQGCILPEEATAELRAKKAWAIYIDDASGECIWYSEDLPDTIPLKYTASDIARLTRGYIDGYPTFTGEGESGLMILGYPKDSFWKHMWPSWDLRFIKNLPQILLAILIINLIVIFLIYTAANTNLLKSIRPLIRGIQDLSTGEPVSLRETGLLSEIAANINRAATILQSQKAELRRKEVARANWIAGVSHDIRTPLSMVMGYAGQLEGADDLTQEQRKKASIILRQSRRIKELINDLNLASKLEYNMQPMSRQQENVVSIVRQVVVDYMNMDIGDKYPMQWLTDEDLTVCTIAADKELLKRAIGNLIQNSINHNETGCQIYVAVVDRGKDCEIRVEDSGIGASDALIEKLNHTPHYMVCDTSTTEQRHGLGLLIVRQIISGHGGKVFIDHSQYGGLLVRMMIPK